jgi:hypothetical protein
MKTSHLFGNAITITGKKLESLAKKYFSIPPEYLPYCPSPPPDAAPLDNNNAVNTGVETVRVEAKNEIDEEAKVAKKRGRKRKKSDDPNIFEATGIQRPGRPRNAQAVDSTLFNFEVVWIKISALHSVSRE